MTDRWADPARRRCQLVVPASSEKMLHKAAELEVDGLILDLEDGVAPSAKAQAREQLGWALRELSFKAQTLSVRINPTTLSMCRHDTAIAVTAGWQRVRAIVLPKADHPRDIHFLDVLLGQLEREQLAAGAPSAPPFAIEAQVETVVAMMSLEAIAAASPRLETLSFGPGDYAASQGIPQSAGDGGDPLFWSYHRHRLAMVARAFGLQAIDGPHFILDDADSLERAAQAAASYGLAGKWAIHPQQVETIQRAFTPSPEQIARAEKIISAYQQALAQGQGALAVEGKMIDEALVRMCRETLQRR
ncbi:MAG: HpcH/HpaI aldolase/citrate lyase family protein [Candidatus Competibacterales bacterium]